MEQYTRTMLMLKADLKRDWLKYGVADCVSRCVCCGCGQILTGFMGPQNN